MPWSFVGQTTENGQGSPPTTWAAPGGLAVGDLLVVAIWSSSAGYGVADFVSGYGFTNGPGLSNAVVPQITLATAAKTAVLADLAGWLITDPVPAAFYDGLVAAYRWTGGAASIGDLTAFRGTTTTIRDTVSPLALACGAYTAGDTDNLGLYLVGSVRGNVGGHPTITVPAGVTTDATHSYDDWGEAFVLGSEVQAAAFPARSFSSAFVAPAGAGVAGRLANELTIPGTPGFGFGATPSLP